MNNYWIFRHYHYNTSGEEAYIHHDNLDKKPGYIELSSRTPLNETLELPVLCILDDEYHKTFENVEWFDVLDIRGFLLVSEKFKNVLEGLGGNSGVEFIPISITYSGKPVDKTYYILNIIAEQPIIDLEKSDVEFSIVDKKEIVKIDYLKVSDHSPPEDLHFFGLLNAPKYFGISNEFKEALEKNHIDGYVLYPKTGFSLWSSRKKILPISKNK